MAKEAGELAKVLLLNPPHPEGKGFTREGRCTQESGVWATQWPPVSLATTAAFLERDGHSLKLIDCPAVRVDSAFLKGAIEAFQPDFAFWTTGTPTLSHDLNVGELVKKSVPDCVTGVFGTHVTVLPEVALKHPSIDLVVRREPEETIREICIGQPEYWVELAGISFRDRNTGAIRHTLDRDFIQPDSIPAPAWHHLDLSPYRLPLKGTPFLIVAPIRGCPYPCGFCTAPLYYGKSLRKRPAASVMDEIARDMKEFRVSDFFVWADTFTADKTYVRSFCCEIMVKGLRIAWACNSRVDTVDREMLTIMKAAGLWMISFGLESGNRRILEQIGKGITVEQSKKAVSMAHDLGIRTSGHFILGLPGETESSMRDTLRLALELPLDIAQFYAAAPFPGTRLHNLATKMGWIRNGSSLAQGHAEMDLPGLPARRVDAFRRYAYRRFYERPRSVARILSMVEPKTMGHLFRDLAAFAGWAGD